jgi:hypothetical protein
LNKPETNRIIRNKGKFQTSNEEKMAIITSDAIWRGSLPPLGGTTPVVAPRHWFLGLRW